MESILAGKPRAPAIGAVRALAAPLRDHWGDLDGFRQAGMDVLAKEGGGVLYDEMNSLVHLEQIYRQVARLRAVHFRPLENAAQLDVVLKELDLAAAKANAPMRQGMLWIASRIQQWAISYLNSPVAEAHLAKVLEAVGKHRDALTRAMGDPEKLSLERIEAVLATFSNDELGDAVDQFERSSLAGHLLEQVRKAARNPPDLKGGDGEMPETQALTPLLGLLTDPVRTAELKDARARYTRLDDDQKSRLYNEFRHKLLRVLKEVAAYAPIGFETFCQAIEAKLFPYPDQVDFIRSYARPIFDNAAQSTIFTDANTSQSVKQRYETLVKSRQGNPFVLEIAKAFAIRNFKDSDSKSKRAFMKEVDLQEEFGWPTSLEELEDAMTEHWS